MAKKSTNRAMGADISAQKKTAWGSGSLALLLTRLALHLSKLEHGARHVCKALGSVAEGQGKRNRHLAKAIADCQSAAEGLLLAAVELDRFSGGLDWRSGG